MNREEKIREFKKTTPAGILKQFKSDDDIWDYLNNQGEWEGTITIKDLNLHANSKKEAEKMIKNAINSVFNSKEETC